MADCVDATSFFPAEAGEMADLAQRRADLGIPAERKVVVYLGLLADYQGTDALLHAANHLLKQKHEVHFLIMGFPAVEHYQNMAHQLGIADHCTFTGKIPYLEARDHLVLGDIAVAPKLSKTEGNGKVLNYMAVGLPTVAFETPVSREYLADVGFYATPGDPLSLAEALARGLAETPNAHRGQMLRKMAEDNYSWDQAAETILRAYESVCHG
jgi:glycosyltransferase involved in cell wall biosynthesis